ncbi:MAG: substrate-binding domain-containing protein [Rubrivivax sp.]|jgi:phosphate transport system substrate-binding protein
MNRRHFALCATALACLGSLPLTAMANPLEIAGSTTVDKTVVEPTVAAARAATGIEPKMMAVGSVKGLQMLVEGRVKVAALSDTLEEAVAALKKAGVTTIPGNLKFNPVVNEQLVPIVHPSNPVKALSREQLRDLFSGKITNWKDVGGPDAPVVPVVAAANSGTRGVFDRAILGTQKAAASAKEVRTAAAEVAEVARTSGAIGMVGEGTAAGGGSKIKEINGPAVSRTLGFVTLGEPGADVAKLIAWWRTPEAQKLFAK